MARTVATGTDILPKSLLEELYDASSGFASVAETLEVLMDKRTMRRVILADPEGNPFCVVQKRGV